MTGALLRTLAGRAPVAVFAAVGVDAEARVDELMLAPGLMRVASPRHAELLLVAGPVRGADRQALRTVHDQIPPPRATLWWGADPFGERAASASAALRDDPSAALHRLRDSLLQQRIESEPDWLPDEPPAPWRGIGPHGQGGKGMMGGKPYGRPLAMTADDLRDGLALDAFELQLGPYLQLWPPGLVLSLVLQGDVLQSARVLRPPLADASLARWLPLHAAARLLAVLQLPALAERCRRTARDQRQGRSVDWTALQNAVRRSGALLAIPAGLGRCRFGAVEDDVRKRLASWLQPPTTASDPRTAAQRDRTLCDLLPGLEWMEAMLVINSFLPDRLQSIAGLPASESESGSQPDRPEHGP